MTQPMIVQQMSHPDFYPHRPETVELLQTHISWVFIAGDEVYKIKKPVDFGFLDFTTLEKRKFYCDEELRLNRRLAPSIYLDVVAITVGQDGRAGLGGGGEIVEYAVHMKKLPQDRMLKTLLAEKRMPDKTMDTLAVKIAQFHKTAQTGGPIDEMGSLATITQNNEENFTQTEKYIDVTISAPQYDFIREYVKKFLNVHRPLFEKRVAEHKIRDCHGDLHLEHICVADDIIVFDCIEFNERFRFGDTAAEVAFLTMDLDYNGYQQHAIDFTRAYLHHSGDTTMSSLLNFYRCYYAYVRGKVTSFRLDQQELPDAERNQIRRTAAKYFDLALTYASRLEKPALIITAGLIGSGKSFQARHLAARLGAEIIRTDVLRKQMLNIPPAEKHHDAFGKGIYSSDISQKTYEKAMELSARIISRGKPVIIDASFSTRAYRALAVSLAGRLGVPYYIIECTCPDKIVKQRLIRRANDKDNPSDGRWEILAEQKKHYEPITEIPENRHFTVDTSVDSEASRCRMLRAIRMAQL
ncbi:MAG TPA: AAA family ATPase [Smithellaceae bacterium]|nr:AAA family ATPase [Smithellaceae bacterium]